MEVCIFIEPHRGATFDTQLRFAQHVERCGFDGFFRADHFMAMGSSGGEPGPTDSWLTLGAIARETSRIRLGTLVTSMTFRHPAPLAIAVAQVDQMSRGRVELGIGAGWYELEHVSLGIPFPPAPERFERLAEQIEIITGLWRSPVGQAFTYNGRHYSLKDAPGLPKPIQPAGPPIIVGGRGPRRTPVMAARYADEYNAGFQNVDDAAQQFKRVRSAAEQIGRDTVGQQALRMSIGVVVAVGESESEVKQRASVLYEKNSALPKEDPVIGPPEKLVERIGQLRNVGVDRVYLRLTDLADLDHVELIAKVLPQMR